MSESGRVGRNDPCPCGSGIKYKRCCMARDRAAQAERVAWQKAAQDMRIALLGYAKEADLAVDLGAGLGLFWQDRYTLDTVEQMSVDESLRFFDWFAHDVFLGAPERPEWQGKRLIEVYRAEAGDTLTEKEAAILDAWIESPPGSAFVVKEVDAAEGTAVLRDLFLPGRQVTVANASAAKHGEMGQILLARPLPEQEVLRLSDGTVILPASEEEGLRRTMEEAQRAYAADHPEATVEAFLRERAYLLTHYALEWADREGRPAVAADDPERGGLAARAVRRTIKASQKVRVQR
ncbi:MAG: YecA family protein [Anaerolineae bacterium]